MTTETQRTANDARPTCAFFEVMPRSLKRRRVKGESVGLYIANIGSSVGIGGAGLDIIDLGKLVARLQWVLLQRLEQLPPSKRLALLAAIDVAEEDESEDD